MANSTRTTEDDLTDEQKAERDAQLAAARRMTDAEAEEFGRRVEAAWAKYRNAE
jgi:hypothetical protein